jgi:hypothetical protein
MGLASLAKKNNIKDSRKRLLKGGAGTGSIFKLTSYKYLLSVLVLISYLLFIFSTILFINACIYLHKITMVNPSNAKYYKLIDTPIFEYLKVNNFIVLDKFLLNADSNLKPPSIIFWTIVGIVLASIILLGIHYWFLSNTPAYIDYKEQEPLSIPYVIINFLPYLFIFIIVILFNQLQLQNIGGLKEIKKSIDHIVSENMINMTAIKAKNTKEDLQMIKKVLQKYISNPSLTFKIEDFNEFIDNSDNNNAIAIDIGAIFDIYKRNLSKKQEDKTYSDKNVQDKIYFDKQFERKYMNHIDEYFDLLKYNKDNKIEDDYYTELYLLGIIYYNDKDNIENNTKNYSSNRYELEKVLKRITSKVRVYFEIIIGLYVVMCVGILAYLIVFNINIKMLFVNVATINNFLALAFIIGLMTFLSAIL